MKRVAALAAAAAAHLALQSVQMWWVLASTRPLLLLLVAYARGGSLVAAGWAGLGIGLAEDVLADRVLGPGGISCALAAMVVVVVTRRFELTGPLSWIVGSLVAAAGSETAWQLVNRSLGHVADHGWLGSLAAVATTAAAGMVVAVVDRGWQAWRSPTRIRRRGLR